MLEGILERLAKHPIVETEKRLRDALGDAVGPNKEEE